MLDNLRVQTTVIEAAHRRRVQRLLFLASSCIYPRECSQPMRPEQLGSGPIEPTSQAYATAKIAGLELCRSFARQYGVWNSYDPKANLEAGVRHLKDLLSRLNLPEALAAYNAGEGTVQRYGGLPPFPETQTYVRNILRRIGPQIRH